MAVTPNLNLDKEIGDLTDGQENKITALNQRNVIHRSNLDLIDAAVPVFIGSFSSQPASGTAPVGSVYLNTTDNKMYYLRDKTPDVYTSFVSGTTTYPTYEGSQASDPSGTFQLGTRYYNTTSLEFRTLTSTGPNVWTNES